jgi:hypothetical protein
LFITDDEAAYCRKYVLLRMVVYYRDLTELACSARSWSYDNMTTYPVMPMPRRKEIRYERRVVDGVATVVETEVEVQPELKRLFLFPGKEQRR